MKGNFKDYLFSHHVLVNDNPEPITIKTSFNTIITLVSKFGIRIKTNARLATESMIHDAERNLGFYVPAPFYRGFPDTVRELTPDQLLYDQLYHYTMTYGMGWFDTPGHSIFENLDGDYDGIDSVYEKMIPEQVQPKDFTIMDEADAKQELFYLLDGLCKSTRPLKVDQKELIFEAYKEYGASFISEGIASKTTASELLYRTKDMAFIKGMRLPDMIKVLEYIQYSQYNSENLKKLNLKNQDRKFIINLLDYFLKNDISLYDIRTCFEKRKIWQGLLHHVHYKPKTKGAEMFIKQIREGVNISAYSKFEAAMAQGKTAKAAETLKCYKGESILSRNMNYILSRCTNEKEVTEVLTCLGQIQSY